MSCKMDVKVKECDRELVERISGSMNSKDVRQKSGGMKGRRQTIDRGW